MAYVDGYGNVKTTWDETPADIGQRIEVTIGDHSAVATVSDATFAVPEGEMSFAPGSSGWPVAGGYRRFHELLLRGASAAEHLGWPAAGTPIFIRPR